MRILLDTHAFLWFVLGDAKLSGDARLRIEDPDCDKLISPASYWEIAIKISLGKYSLPQPYEEFMNQALDVNAFCILPITPQHTAVLTNLPFHHRDPFDRLIISQATHEKIPVISADISLDAYGVTRIW